MRQLALACFLAISWGCSPTGGGPADGDVAVGPDVAPDADAGGDTGGEPPHPPTRAERGLAEVRAIIHLHSAFSHDACDEAYEKSGNTEVPWTCVRRMKAALCQERIGVAFMTDHPSFMREQPFEDLLYAEPEAGDIVLADGEGTPWGVTFACPAGGGGLDGRVTLVAGFEGPHTMPIGLRRHFANPAFYGTRFSDSTPDEELSALTAEVRAVGGRVSIAHSEETDLSWQTIARHDVTAMELYNFHANFNQVLLEGDLFGALSAIDVFLGQGPEAPPADLVGLALLDAYPLAALEKWRNVNSERPITAIAGSDVHENVLLPALGPSIILDELALDAPNVAKALEVGGPIILSDGERIDAYERIFRWVQNRVLVDADADPLLAVEDAIDRGRVLVVFEMLGDVDGIELFAELADGSLAEMGATVPAGSTLWIRTPNAPVPGRNATWTEGGAAEIITHLVHTAAQVSEVLLSLDGPGQWHSMALTKPGSYQLEVTLVPRHLAGVLKARADLSEREYRWVETNAVRVAP